MSATIKGLHCLISGRVQGVFYRASTQRKALELGVTGWVRNLPDGRVEVFAFGDPEQLETLTNWLWQGSSIAKVTAVECEEVAWQDVTGFLVR